MDKFLNRSPLSNNFSDPNGAEANRNARELGVTAFVPVFVRFGDTVLEIHG